MTENQALPGVIIELDGRQYELIYNLYAFYQLKTVANLNALKGEVDFMNPEQLLYFLWAGLITHHEELDGDLVNGKPDQALAAGLKKVGKMLTMDKMSYIGNVIREAFTNATKLPNSRSEAKAKKQ